ncbi:MAG: response regulator [Candidatus Latescibacteria bacterium]|nr:response regulator [Candidatus Latescibacterota bacterium]
MTNNANIKSDGVESDDIALQLGERIDVLGCVLSALHPDREPERVMRDISAALSKLIPHDRILLVSNVTHERWGLDRNVFTSSRYYPPVSESETDMSAHKWVAFYKTSLLRSNVKKDMRFKLDGSFLRDGRLSALYVPLCDEQGHYGVLSFASDQAERYGKADLGIVEWLAAKIGNPLSVFQACLGNWKFRQMPVNMQLDLDRTLEQILWLIQQEGYDRVRIYLYDQKTDEMIGGAQVGIDQYEGFKGVRLPVSEDPHSQKTLAGRQAQIYRWDKDEGSGRLRLELDAPKNSNWAELPLFFEEADQVHMVGKISLDNNKTGRALDPIALNRLMGIASSAALSIRHAQLYASQVIDAERSVRGFFPLRNDNGQVSKILGMTQDITQRRRLEEDARKAHNLESLGVLAAGIAHDFNNVLTGVIGNLSLLGQLLSSDSEAYEVAHDALLAASRTKGLTHQLMTFARGGTPIKETASIEMLIKETVDLSLRGANTKPEFNFADGLSSVHADCGQMGQVIQNLVLNASQAMPDGGTLWISAENVEVFESGPLSLEPGAYVLVSIKDEGIGMSESVMARVFDPYFTTKEAGHGLGLSISYSIILKHNGHIEVTSQQDKGTTFTFYLPVSNVKAVTAVVHEKTMVAGEGRVLLMDDEDLVHRTMGRALGRFGYEVESVYNGENTLQVYKDALGSDRAFDVVILDLTIPGEMGGKEVVGKLLEIDPRARVLVSSGYSNAPVMARFLDYGFVGSIAKPVDIDELAYTVKSALDL